VNVVFLGVYCVCVFPTVNSTRLSSCTKVERRADCFADEPTPASSTAVVVVTVGDVNDNAPEISAKSQHVVFCEYPQNGTYLEIVDKDTPGNGPPFQYSVVDMTDWFVERCESTQILVLVFFNLFQFLVRVFCSCC